jgi:hypothetical protein
MRGHVWAPAGAALLWAASAAAEFKIDSPVVTPGELALESAGSLSPGRADGRSFTASAGYGLLPFAFFEVEGAWEREEEGEAPTRYQATTLAGTFQLWKPRGDESLVFGFKAEYGFSAMSDTPDAVKFGPLLQAELGPVTATFNLFGEREVGSGARNAVEASYGVQLLYPFREEVGLALELFGEERSHRFGPTLTGEISFGPGKFAYELGWLFGLSRQTPDHTLKWLAQYVLPF